MRTVDVNYFNDPNTVLPATMSVEERRGIIASTDYRVKVAVNLYKMGLRHGKDFAVEQAASQLDTHEERERFLEVVLALELCGQGLL